MGYLPQRLFSTNHSAKLPLQAFNMHPMHDLRSIAPSMFRPRRRRIAHEHDIPGDHLTVLINVIRDFQIARASDRGAETEVDG